VISAPSAGIGSAFAIDPIALGIRQHRRNTALPDYPARAAVRTLQIECRLSRNDSDFRSRPNPAVPVRPLSLSAGGNHASVPETGPSRPAIDPKRSVDSDRHGLSGGSALGERGGSLTFQRKRQTRLYNLVSTMPRPDKQGRWQHDLGKSTTPPSERAA
jgi:hypothetical protein